MKGRGYQKSYSPPPPSSPIKGEGNKEISPSRGKEIILIFII
jgi:hypothetical protein